MGEALSRGKWRACGHENPCPRPLTRAHPYARRTNAGATATCAGVTPGDLDAGPEGGPERRRLEGAGCGDADVDKYPEATPLAPP